MFQQSASILQKSSNFKKRFGTELKNHAVLRKADVSFMAVMRKAFKKEKYN